MTDPEAILELKVLFGKPDIAGHIKRGGRMRWLGHVEGMPSERLSKEMLYGRSGGARRRARPRLRWLNDFEENLRELRIR